MILGNSKKLIISSFLLINFIHPSKSDDLEVININGTNELSWTKISNEKTLPNSSKLSLNNYSEKDFIYKNFFKNFIFQNLE